VATAAGALFVVATGAELAVTSAGLLLLLLPPPQAEIMHAQAQAATRSRITGRLLVKAERLRPLPTDALHLELAVG
jgi:hypothetical protein